MELAEHLYRKAVAGLESIDPSERGDTYAVSLYVEDESDDPRRPAVKAGTNTERQVRFTCDPPSDDRPNPRWAPTDEQEARWNYADWLQNELAVLCGTRLDPTGNELREQWIRDAGWWFEYDGDWYTADRLGPLITAAFVELCVSLARRLHEDGDVVRVFGRPIPVLVHELEYYGEIADQNVRANPPGLAQGLVDWIESQRPG